MRKFIGDLAKGAGAILRQGFRKNFEVRIKDEAWNIVTEYDLASEKFIIGKIKKKFPEHSVLAEESGASGKSKDLWIIDPLDGTHAFARGIPQFCVSIGFAHNNELVLGAIYDPIADELFIGEKGKGATLNGKPIKVSTADGLRQQTLACVLLGTAGSTIAERRSVFVKAIENKMWLSHLESVALCAAYVAAGRYDFLLTKNLYPWDYSAGAIIMKEAGAKVTQANGKKYTWKSNTVLAANPKLHSKVLKKFKNL